MSNVVQLYPDPLTPDDLLAAATGELDMVVIIGVTKDGMEYVSYSTDEPHALWMVERFKRTLLADDDE